jgi:hypothetical protein
LHVALGARVRFVPCLAFELGHLHAQGKAVVPATHVDRPWFATGAIARFELALFDALALEVAGYLAAPLVRDRFYVDVDSTVHRTSAITGGVAAGLSLRFP